MPRGATRVFFQKVSRGCQNGEIWLFSLKTKRKHPFLAAIFKIHKARSPVPHISTPMVPKRINATPCCIWSKILDVSCCGHTCIAGLNNQNTCEQQRMLSGRAFWRFFAVVANSEHMNNSVTHAHLSFSFPKWFLLWENICVTTFLIRLCHRRAPFAKLSHNPVLEPIL